MNANQNKNSDGQVRKITEKNKTQVQGQGQGCKQVIGYNFANGDVYFGDRTEGGKVSGTGTYKWKDGSNYCGAFFSGHREGHGVMIYKTTGHSYKGRWINNERSGFGTLYLPNGISVQGHWYKDNFIDEPPFSPYTNWTSLTEDQKAQIRQAIDITNGIKWKQCFLIRPIPVMSQEEFDLFSSQNTQNQENNVKEELNVKEEGSLNVSPRSNSGHNSGPNSDSKVMADSGITFDDFAPESKLVQAINSKFEEIQRSTAQVVNPPSMNSKKMNSQTTQVYGFPTSNKFELVSEVDNSDFLNDFDYNYNYFEPDNCY